MRKKEGYIMKTIENLSEKLFNKDVMSLDTYIMFKLKEKKEQLKQ